MKFLQSRFEEYIEVGPKNILTKLNCNIIPKMNLSNIENRREFLELNV